MTTGLEKKNTSPAALLGGSCSFAADEKSPRNGWRGLEAKETPRHVLGLAFQSTPYKSAASNSGLSEFCVYLGLVATAVPEGTGIEAAR